MPLHLLAIAHNGKAYRFEPVAGQLLVRPVADGPSGERPSGPRVQQAVDLNNTPYRLQQGVTVPEVTHVSWWLRTYAHALVRTCRISFTLARILALIRIPVYRDAGQAIAAFRLVFPGGVQQDLCLPRSLFAAVTSKRFRTNGALFIGVFLPARSMHAWVIEDGTQPDPHDRGWINFRPVAVYTR